MTEGGRGGPKEFLWVYERCWVVFWVANTAIFGGFDLSSDQLNNNNHKCNLLLVLDFFGYAKKFKSRDFFG